MVWFLNIESRFFYIAPAGFIPGPDRNRSLTHPGYVQLHICRPCRVKCLCWGKEPNEDLLKDLPGGVSVNFSVMDALGGVWKRKAEREEAGI